MNERSIFFSYSIWKIYPPLRWDFYSISHKHEKTGGKIGRIKFKSFELQLITLYCILVWLSIRESKSCLKRVKLQKSSQKSLYVGICIFLNLNESSSSSIIFIFFPKKTRLINPTAKRCNKRRHRSRIEETHAEPSSWCSLSLLFISPL